MSILVLNKELQTKLGVKPLYGWQLGSTLTRMIPVLNPDGSPTYEHRADASGLVMLDIKLRKVEYAEFYELVRPGIEFSQRWVLCREQVNTIDPLEWRRMYSGLVPWVKREWVPLDVSGGETAIGGHLMSEPGQPVSEFLQDRAIKIIKMCQHIKETYNTRQLHDMQYDDRKARDQRIDQDARRAQDIAPLGGWTRTPGAKDGVVAFSEKLTKKVVQ